MLSKGVYSTNCLHYNIDKYTVSLIHFARMDLSEHYCIKKTIDVILKNIASMFCLIWTSHRISHLRLGLRCNIVLRNPFSQNISTIVYYTYICIPEYMYINWSNLFTIVP